MEAARQSSAETLILIGQQGRRVCWTYEATKRQGSEMEAEAAWTRICRDIDFDWTARGLSLGIPRLRQRNKGVR